MFPEILNSVNYYQNNSNQGNWVGFKLTATVSNRDAFGAKVHLHSGDRTFLKEVRDSDSHASQSSSNLHFGLGEIQEIDSIIIYWPSGHKEVFQDININKYINIQEGMSTIINENVQILSQVRIYPNPSSTFIYIEINNTNHPPYLIRLLDIKGMLILENEIYHTKQKIEMGAFDSGLYRLVIYSGSKTISKTISIINP